MTKNITEKIELVEGGLIGLNQEGRTLEAGQFGGHKRRRLVGVTGEVIKERVDMKMGDRRETNGKADIYSSNGQSTEQAEAFACTISHCNNTT